MGLQYLVADSTLYSAKSLRELGDTVWGSRVPETFAAAREVIQAMADDLAASRQDTAHRAVGVVQAGIRQRWLVVSSTAMRLGDAQKRFCKGSI